VPSVGPPECAPGGVEPEPELEPASEPFGCKPVLGGDEAGADGDDAGCCTIGGQPGSGGGVGQPGGGGGVVVTGGSSASKIVCVTVCTVSLMFVAMLVELTVFVCVTSPSSPGLKIRIEIDVLHIPQSADGAEGAPGGGADGGGVDGQFQTQFQIHVGAARSEGLIPAGGVSPQFHDQFQTQVDGTFGAGSGVDTGADGGVCGALVGVELIPPELPF
jgi:hypothetical protein